ncbi:MAG: hypothetical protein VKJ04_08955 [Vampirovibrionales bacterium]|nr:hypothetical protein [Vampirovibrionales bacterium]
MVFACPSMSVVLANGSAGETLDLYSVRINDPTRLFLIHGI